MCGALCDLRAAGDNCNHQEASQKERILPRGNGGPPPPKGGQNCLMKSLLMMGDFYKRPMLPSLITQPGT